MRESRRSELIRSVCRWGRKTAGNVVWGALAVGPAALFMPPCALRAAEGAPNLVFCCEVSNDLYQAATHGGEHFPRYPTATETIDAASEGAGVLILADGYPERPTSIDPRLLDIAARKSLRLYVEYPEALPGLEIGLPRPTKAERAVVTSDMFGPELPPLGILFINGMHLVPVTAAGSHIVSARVAGFDRAVFGLPKDTDPILFEHSTRKVLVAATKLSHFVTGRYAPQEAWRHIWQGVFGWLGGKAPLPELQWEPTVRAAYRRDEPLPADVEERALRRALAWFDGSKLLLHPSRMEAFHQAVMSDGLAATPSADTPVGDGSLGILEGPLSIIGHDGSQWQSVARRGDCHGESAMALAFGGKVFNDPHMTQTAQNLLDFYYFTSDACQGPWGDPDHGAYGLIAWGIDSPAWYRANYGDDNARLLMGSWAVAALTGGDRWDELMVRCLIAQLRTTGPLGFRGGRIDASELRAGWEPFFRRERVNLWPHYEAYLWACYLWAYEQTGYELFYERAATALRMTMEQYSDGWQWTNGLAQEKARMLLPLAWLVRVQDTPEHRVWLRRVFAGLAELMQPCGAIREQLGLAGRGSYAPPASNEEYGGNEASLIQQEGDPLCDLLYTVNFALLGLHEAAAATGDREMQQTEDRLAAFLCRIQVRSPRLPSLDGGWFRAFDYRRWEHWGSNADAGWGAWAIESGWTQGWITSVLALRRMRTSLWDLTKESRIERHFDRYRREMLPQ